MVKKVTLLLTYIIMVFMLSYSTVYAAPLATADEGTSAPADKLNINTPSAILTEADRGQILYEKNPREKLHISAACKLMTILITVESADLSSNVTISQDSVEAEGSALNLEVGQKYNLGDLLYGIMLTSANDAAKAVAEYIGGGDSGKFVNMMNNMAAKLNMKDTHFTNPTGLYDENQYTTAYDISLLMKYAVGNAKFNSIFSVKAKPWEYQDGKTRILTSQNKLFWSYDGIEGGKTGYNDIDKQTVVTTAVRNNMRLICIVLDSPEADMFNDAATLLDYGFNGFKKSILVHKGDVLKTVNLDGNNINLICQNDVSYVHPVGESYIKDFNATSMLQSPVSTSVQAGTAVYTLNDGTRISISLFPQTEIVPPEDFLSKAKRTMANNKNILYLVIFLLLVEVILILFNIVKLIVKLTRKILHH